MPTDYDNYRTNNHIIKVIAVVVLAFTLHLGLFSYEMIADNFNDRNTESIIGLIIFTPIVSMMYLYFIGTKPILICEGCNEFIDYEKEYYITNHDDHRIDDKKIYHINCYVKK